MPFPPTHVFISLGTRLLMAFVVGGAIGFEREVRGHPAGLRTHMLVCLGACLIAMIDSLVPYSQGKITGQIVTGVGFLGAGTIIRSERGAPVHGLTTAASLWCIAGIGIALGVGGTATWLALSASVIILITLVFIGELEKDAIHRQRNRSLTIALRSPDEATAATVSSTVLDSLTRIGVKLSELKVDQPDASPLTKVLHLRVTMTGTSTPEDIARVLCDNPRVSQFTWDVD